MLRRGPCLLQATAPQHPRSLKPSRRHSAEREKWGGDRGRRRERRRKNNERVCLRYSELLCSSVCFDMMLEAFMNRQGHDNRPKPTGQREPEVDVSALFQRDNFS
ncbi:hypothetical protein Q8A73_023089 [Channa argus]|nr:hypothetical protein Q8A73_023089 [Channa argus]